MSQVAALEQMRQSGTQAVTISPSLPLVQSRQLNRLFSQRDITTRHVNLWCCTISIIVKMCHLNYPKWYNYYREYVICEHDNLWFGYDQVFHHGNFRSQLN